MGTTNMVPVYTGTKRGTAYLEIIRQGSSVRVQTTLAGRTLNKFWTVWLRWLILAKTDSLHGFSVELLDSFVVVTSNVTPEGLVETVRSLAAGIVPLPNPPITRLDRTTAHEAWWDIEPGTDVGALLQELHPYFPNSHDPKRVRLLAEGWRIRLLRPSNYPLNMRDLCRLVELHAALPRRS